MAWVESESKRRARIKYRSSQKGKLKARGRFLVHTFGITLAQYDQMVTDQAGVCAICKRPCSTGKRLAIDHDHDTNRVRGLLCTRCNRHLGWFDLLATEILTYVERAQDEDAA
jgi:hypothetical protein